MEKVLLFLQIPRAACAHYKVDGYREIGAIKCCRRLEAWRSNTARGLRPARSEAIFTQRGVAKLRALTQ